ncbi:MAG: peptidase S8 [Lachnospiraceae bacterium]|jgi:hypothetical protein|nr:peptidase S8 [Lachnospiraceae bacterium]
MKKHILKGILISFFCIFLLSGCSKEPHAVTQLADLEMLGKGYPVITNREPYFKWDRGALVELSSDKLFDLKKVGWDLRSYDLSSFNLLNHPEELKYVTFDTDTIWPNDLPSDFNPSAIMDLGLNPGLNIKSLHNKSITGMGVNIAIIDQSLLLEHVEYKDNVMLYEKLNCFDNVASMHGPDVTSIAVGQKIGVAPDAKLYYIASTFGKYKKTDFEIDLTVMADGIKRVLEINKHLQDKDKIRVISISMGFQDNMKGYDEVYNAIEEAKKSNVFVVTTNTYNNYRFILMGLGRELTADPDDLNSYTPGIFWADKYFEDDPLFNNDRILLVPMDSRTYASFSGEKDYSFSSVGGSSWACPWLAGMYALCLQVNPEITMDEFIHLAFETGDSITIEHNSKKYTLKTIINPVKLVNAIEQ